MDLIDYFVEEVSDSKTRRRDGWQSLETRSETILRKKQSPIEITIHESDRGILETNLTNSDLRDGCYLARAWSAAKNGASASHGRQTTFTPSYRYITDLKTDEIHTVLAGGPSGRRSSQYYKTDIERWLNGTYKTLQAVEEES